MVQTREDAQKFIETITREFKEKHTKTQTESDLIFINNVERENVKGYHGREILELLQNADDAYQKALDEGKQLAELNVCIKLSNNVLSISNTGTFFDEDGIKAIIQSYNSPKRGKYIGNKGTGFRSVLNWAEKIRIFSGVFHLEFSREIANKIFDSISGAEQILNQRKKYPQLYVPILSVPKYIEESSEYDPNATTIEITIDPKKNEDDYNVEAQLKNIDFRILLFLPNTSKITITIDGEEKVYERTKSASKVNGDTSKAIIDKQSKVSLKKHGNEVVEEYDLFERIVKEVFEEDNIKQDVQLALAVPSNIESFCEENYLYTFFPIRNTQSPFSCIMHATYALSASRDSLSASDSNKKIVGLQLEHLRDVAQIYINEGDYKKALDLLTPININKLIYNWKFAQGFSNFKVEGDYLSLLKEFKFLPTVNEKFISIQDEVGMMQNGYPQCFKGDSFAWLIKEIANEKTRYFINLLAWHFHINLEKTEADLCDCINAASDNWNAEDRAEVFDWWVQRSKGEYLPQLLKKQDGAWLSYRERCYFLDGAFEDVTLPQWVKTPALMKEDQEALFERAGHNQKIREIRDRGNMEGRPQQISRLICQNNIYSLVADFTYRDRSNIIPAVNASVDTYEQAVDFVKWLWKNYGKEEGWTPPQGNESSSIKYKLPSAKRDVRNGEELFFGEEYDNLLAEKLFTEDYAKLPSLNVFGFDCEELEGFKAFIAKFGVRHFPQIKEKRFANITDKYATQVEKALERQAGATGLHSYTLLTIDNLEQILKNLSVQDIADWISKDGELYAHLRSVRQNGGQSSIKCTYKKRYHAEVSGSVMIEDYILSVFNSVKWVEISGEKYAPREIVLDKVGSPNKKFEKLIPYFDIRSAAKNMVAAETEKLMETLNLFDFCPSVLHLGSENFYGLLLRIPAIESFNDSIDMYRTIYRLVEQLDHEINYENSQNKNRFFSEGKVLVKYNKGLEYRNAGEAFLPSSKIICKKDVAIIEKSWRKGNAQIFCNIFNCKEYTEETQIVYDTIQESAANEEFQKYFKEFKEYAKAYKQVNANIQRDFDKLSVTLVSVMEVAVAGQRERIDEEYVLLSKSATQVYITVFQDTFDVMRLSEHIEDIFVNIANVAGFDANRIGELFRTRSKEDREFLIVKEFNSLSVLSDDGGAEALKRNFLDTVAKFDARYNTEKLDINFADFDSDESVKKVIDIFKDLNINTITEFSEKGFEYRLSFDAYYRNELERVIRNAEIQYKNYLYLQALENVDLQSSFLKDFRKFVNYQFDSHITGPMDVTEHLIGKFGDWSTQVLSNMAGAKYDENYKKMNPDNQFDDLIRNDDKAQIMIYFEQKDSFNEWLQEKQGQFEAERDTIKKNPYELLSEISLQEKEISYSDKSRLGTRAVSSGRGYGKSYTSTMEEKNNRKKKILGNKGEFLVYKYLNEKYPNRVTAKSEAFEELGVLTPGQGDSTRGYDMEYRDDSNKRLFVEVKTGSSNGFIISPKELEFAKSHAETYELYLVYDLEKENPSFCKLPKRFWEAEEFRLRDIIEKIEVAF